MGKSSLDEFIARSRVFQLLDEEGRARMAKISVEVLFAPGDVVMREGEPGDAFYAVLEGKLEVSADDFGETKQVAVLEAGAFAGEIAALTREPRTATVTAVTPARLLRFEIVSVFAVLKDYPQILAELNRLGVKRSEQLLEKLS